MNKQEKLHILAQLRNTDVSGLSNKQQLFHDDIPEEYQGDKDIINVERQVGVRRIERIGYDVIRNSFFVHEIVLVHGFWSLVREKSEIHWYEDFNQYYDYLDGNIYEDACYYQLDLSKIKKRVNKSKMRANQALIDYSITDYTLEPTMDELREYKLAERRKKYIDDWVNKVIDCSSYAKLYNTLEAYKKSKLYESQKIDINFFLWQYIFKDTDDKKRLEIVMRYLSRYAQELIKPLCHVYDPDCVLSLFDCPDDPDKTPAKKKKELKQYIDDMRVGLLSTSSLLHNRIKYDRDKEKYYDPFGVGFDDRTHYYYYCDEYGVYSYFEEFEELMRFRNYDLSCADLTGAYSLKYDFSKCKTGDSTKLPITYDDNYSYSVKKFYRDGKFYAIQIWRSSLGSIVKTYKHTFEYFFDYVSFLDGDLSGADFKLCLGLINLTDTTELNLSNAQLLSSVCEKFGIEYEKHDIESKLVESFDSVILNEKNTELILQSSREIIENHSGELVTNTYSSGNIRVSYISDLHLMHQLMHFNANNDADRVFVIHRVVATLVQETSDYLLIGGDVASDFDVFKLFVKIMRVELDRNHKRRTTVVFVLGNHELWPFPKLSVESIKEKYEQLLNDHGMYLLQNSLLFLDGYDGTMKAISADDIDSFSTAQIRDKLRASIVTFFGGLAFSGYNYEFNANNGIYRDVVTREKEVFESRVTERLYNKIIGAIPDKRLIVFTHSPIKDWHSIPDYHNDYVYVSGHTHKNYFYDDGCIRVYADNQIGYNNKYLHLKWFDVDMRYDIFADYDDGIFEITKEDYLVFCKGVNLGASYGREVNILYMLKKNNYYCFIHRSKSGSLTILNGGALKKLLRNDIEYYYENMDRVIESIETPLKTYTDFQQSIANQIMKIGGSGRIHGCIVDIDFFNHIYVNPIDNTVTAYWASDIIHKKVYPDVLALLKDKCPKLFVNYKKLLDGNGNSVLSNASKKEVSKKLAVSYLSTDIYKASREIRKMQKLFSNVLTVWPDNDNQQLLLGGNPVSNSD